MLSNSLLGQDQGEQGREIKPACAVLKWSIKRKEVGGLGNPRAANCWRLESPQLCNYGLFLLAINALKPSSLSSYKWKTLILPVQMDWYSALPHKQSQIVKIYLKSQDISYVFLLQSLSLRDQDDCLVTGVECIKCFLQKASCWPLLGSQALPFTIAQKYTIFRNTNITKCKYTYIHMYLGNPVFF